MPDRNSSFAKVIDDVITFMTLAEPRIQWQGFTQIDPCYFDGADLWIEDAVDWLDQAAGGKELIPTNLPPETLPRPVDVTMVHDSTGDSDLQTARMRFVNPKTLRGKVHRFFPIMASIVVGSLSLSSGSISIEEHIAGALGNKWVHVPLSPLTRVSGSGLCYTARTTGVYGNTQLNREVVNNMRVMSGWHFVRRAFWRVYLSLEGGIGVTFSTDEEGIREVFRLRDIPPGHRRRAAILHWVTAHYRQRRQASVESLTFVREHFRGVTQFNWNGLRCVIYPPIVRLEQVLEQYQKLTQKLTTVARIAASTPNSPYAQSRKGDEQQNACL